jgi:hypothetical protein
VRLKDPFTVRMLVVSPLPRVTHERVFAECKPGFAMSMGLTANRAFPVVCAASSPHIVGSKILTRGGEYKRFKI